jgi:hypothetical protein
MICCFVIPRCLLFMMQVASISLLLVNVCDGNCCKQLKPKILNVIKAKAKEDIL